ncbi:MAG: DUF3794 domain-containing protein [Defluviitaleaceae bacterium]|nr:DUF3794 domain-containing protein [Defluviitaleaceae bacterium]
MELVREQVNLDQLVGNEQVQVMLEGDLIVPDTKPDMALLLQTEEQVLIERTEAGTDRVNYIGRLNLSVLYVAKSADKAIHTINLSRTLDDFVNLDGVTKDMWVRANATIANIDFRVVNDRKVNYRAIVNVRINAERSDTHEMVVHINDVPENQLLKTSLNLNRTVDNRIDRFAVKEQLVLPSAKPNIREVLQSTASITNQETRLANGRVNLSGEISLTTLYRGDSDDSLIEFIESEIPFNGPVDISGARDDMFADVALQILETNITIRPDDDGEDRVLDIEISVGVELKVYSTDTFPILEDAYIIDTTLNLQKTVVRYPRLVCNNRNQTNVKEVVSLSDTVPPMLQVFRVKGTPHIDDIKTIEDKIIVEGAINTSILYVAESDSTPLASFSTVIPYRQVIEAKGANPTMQPDIAISIDNVSFNMLTPTETEVRLLLTFNTRVTEQEETRIIHDIEFSEIAPEILANQASLTVYIVQPGDNLWKIAKRYNTPLDELLSVNEIENPSKITTGQKLLILNRGASPPPR